MSEKQKNKAPTQKHRAGSVTLSTWENVQKGKDGKDYTNKSFTLQRSYRDGEEWKNTQSLRIQDLPKAIVCMQLAYQEELVKKENTPE